MDNLEAKIAIDLRANRIRIHKNTLHALGDPDYIQLLINPDTQVVAIRKCKTKDPLSHRVNWKILACNQSYELHSKSLIEKIDNLYMNYKPGHVYRITGKAYPGECLAAFKIADSVDIES